MSVMSDRWIKDNCIHPKNGLPLSPENPYDTYPSDNNGWLVRYDQPIIEPFSPQQVKLDKNGNRIVSWGLSSYGYDVRLEPRYKVFTNIYNSVIDPLNFDEKCYVDMEGDSILLPPNSFLLSKTIEYIRVPRDVLVICLGKSTWARTGAVVNVTPLEPEWEGHVVVEVSNTTTLPIRIHANMGIAQFIFLKGNEPCMVSYNDRGGKYQRQNTIQTPKV